MADIDVLLFRNEALDVEDEIVAFGGYDHPDLSMGPILLSIPEWDSLGTPGSIAVTISNAD